MFSSLKRNNRRLKPSHIKAGMVEVYRRRKNYRPDQLARAALREAETINDREEYEEELKLNNAVKELADKDIELENLRNRNSVLRERMWLCYGMLIYWTSIAGLILYQYVEKLNR